MNKEDIVLAEMEKGNVSIVYSARPFFDEIVKAKAKKLGIEVKIRRCRISKHADYYDGDTYSY